MPTITEISNIKQEAINLEERYKNGGLPSGFRSHPFRRQFDLFVLKSIIVLSDAVLKNWRKR